MELFIVSSGEFYYPSAFLSDIELVTSSREEAIKKYNMLINDFDQSTDNEWAIVHKVNNSHSTPIIVCASVDFDD